MNKFFKKIKDAYPKCVIHDDKNYLNFSIGASIVYQLRIQKDNVRIMAWNYPKKLKFGEAFKVIKDQKIEGKKVNGQYKILFEAGVRNPEIFTLRVEIPYKKSYLIKDDFIEDVIKACEQFHLRLMPLINAFQSDPVEKLSKLMADDQKILAKLKSKVEKSEDSVESSVQQKLLNGITKKFPNSEAKKIDKDNFLDIYMPSVNTSKGTHLYFNTGKNVIKIGFYVRDEKFISNVVKIAPENIEAASNGLRIPGNPEFDNVKDALTAAFDFLSNMNFDNTINAISKKNNSKEKKVIEVELKEEVTTQFRESYTDEEELADYVSSCLENSSEKGKIVVLEIKEKDLIKVTINHDLLSADLFTMIGVVGIKSWLPLSKLIGKEESDWVKSEFTEEDPSSIVLLYCNSKYVYAYSVPKEEESDNNDEVDTESDSDIDKESNDTDDDVDIDSIIKNLEAILDNEEETRDDKDEEEEEDEEESEEESIEDEESDEEEKSDEEEIDDTKDEYEDVEVLKYIYIDPKGKQLFPSFLDNSNEFNDGYAWVKIDNKWGYIDKAGKIFASKNNGQIHSYSSGFFKIESDGLFGFADIYGKFIVECKYQDANDFYNGLALVKNNNKIGYINSNGLEVVPCIYDSGEDATSSLIEVSKGKEKILINKSGKVLNVLDYDQLFSFEDGIAMINKDGKYGYINEEAKLIIPIIYDDINDFSNGLAIVENDGNKIIIDKNGKSPFKNKYDDIISFTDGLARVCQDDKYGYIDLAGKEVIKCTFESAESFSQGAAEVEKKGKKLLIDKSGKTIFNIGYDFIGSFIGGIAMVQKGSNWGFVDVSGKMITDFKYDDVRDFSDGLAAVQVDDKWGYINNIGIEVIACQYDNASDFKDGAASVGLTKTYTREKFNGKVLTNDYAVSNYSDLEKLKTIIINECRQIKFADIKLLNNESNLTELIQSNADIYPYLPKEIKEKKSTIDLAILNGYYNEDFLNYINLEDSELLERIIDKNAIYLSLLPEKYKSATLIKIAIRDQSCDIEFDELPKNLQTDFKFFQDLLTFLEVEKESIPFPAFDFSSSIAEGYQKFYLKNPEFIIKYRLIDWADKVLLDDKNFLIKFLKEHVFLCEKVVSIMPSLFEDVDFINLALSLDGTNYNGLNDSFKAKKNILEAALSNTNYLYLNEIPNSLLYNDKLTDVIDLELLIKIIDNNNENIRFIPLSIMQNEIIAKKLIYAARKKNNVLYYASRSLRKDKDFIASLTKENPFVIIFADIIIRDDKAFMSKLVNDTPILFKYCSAKLKSDKNFIIEVVKINGSILQYVEEALAKNQEIYWTALRQNIEVFKLLDNDSKENEEIQNFVASVNGELLNECQTIITSKVTKFNAILNSKDNAFSEDLTIYKSFHDSISDAEIINILKQDCTQVVFITENRLTSNKEFLIDVLKITPYPLRYKSCRSLIGNDELSKLLIISPWSFKYLEEVEKKDTLFIKKLLSINGNLLQYLSDDFRKNFEYINIAVKQNPSTIKHILIDDIDWYEDDFINTMKEVIKANPKLIACFKDHNMIGQFINFAITLDSSIIELINPNSKIYEIDKIIPEISNHYDITFDNDDLVNALNQNGQIFYCDEISNSLKNVCFAIENGISLNWEEEFNKWNNDLLIIETAFLSYPSEYTLNALKINLIDDFNESHYISNDIIEKNPNLYLSISEDLQKDTEFALSFVKNLSKFSNDEIIASKGTTKKAAKKSKNTSESGIVYLHSSFKSNLEFLQRISNLEIDFETLSLFFEKTILNNETFILSYLIKNFDEYVNLPTELQLNKKIALQYGILKIENNSYYQNILIDLDLPNKLKNDKELILEIAKLNINNNHNISEELLNDNKFLLEIIKYQPKLVKAIPEEQLSTEMILTLLKININVFDYLECKMMLVPEIFDFICKNDIKKMVEVVNFGDFEESLYNLKDNKNLKNCINIFEEDSFPTELLKYHSYELLIFNQTTQVKSDISSLYYVNGYCTFTLGYDTNCYVSEDVAGIVPDDVLSDFLATDENWSDYIWENSWHDVDGIYHKNGIIEPATHLKLPNGNILGISLNYSTPIYDNIEECFNDSKVGDFIQIATSDEKAYGWGQWKKYTLEIKPGIFNLNNIEVEFERDIVSGYSYNDPDSTTVPFEEDDDYTTTGKGFSSVLYFNNGTKLVSVDIDYLRDALENESIDITNIDAVKQFSIKYYSKSKTQRENQAS